jgi:putative ABC transport system permease protein
LPLFDKLANTQLTSSLLLKPQILLSLIVLLLLLSFVAGFYPAIFLSRFKSADVFRNVIKAEKIAGCAKHL